MNRSLARLAPLAVLLLVASGCNGTEETPTEPGPTQLVDTFSGTLALNGAFSHPFTVTAPGSMLATLIVLKPADETLPPESAVPVGLALGTWNGSICQIVLANDVTKQGEVVLANSTAVGDFCVRIYDAAGTLALPQAYQIVVDHF